MTDDYRKTFGIFNYHKMIPDRVADYIDLVIQGDRLFNKRFKQCWDNVNFIIDSFICDFEKEGISLSKAQIIKIINHDYDDNRAVYWNLNKRSEDKRKRTIKSDLNKMKLTEYYHQTDNIYSIRRNSTIEFDGIPDMWEFGNCIVIIDISTKKVWYKSKERHLFYVLRRKNNYIGFLIQKNCRKNIINKSA